MRFLSPTEALARAEPDWLIEGILPKSSLSILYGAPDSYKTFVVTDMAACIGSEQDWHGYPVRHPGAVAYVVAEGSEEYPKRLQAWADAHDMPLDATRVHQFHEPVDLLDEHAVDALLTALAELRERTGAPVQLVVFDTLTLCMGGASDENSNSDIARLTRAVNRVRRETGAHVLLVHHEGKATGRPRGASALGGNFPTRIRIARASGRTAHPAASAEGGDGGVKLVCQKQAGGKKFAPISLRLREVPVTLPSGRQVTSLVVEDEGDEHNSEHERAGEQGERRAPTRRIGAGAGPYSSRGMGRNGQPRRRGTGRTNWDADQWYVALCQAADASPGVAAAASVTPAELSRTTGRRANTCLRAVARLVREGRAQAVGGGRYAPLPIAAVSVPAPALRAA
jgi:AAA domain-containing protein